MQPPKWNGYEKGCQRLYHTSIAFSSAGEVSQNLAFQFSNQVIESISLILQFGNCA